MPRDLLQRYRMLRLLVTLATLILAVFLVQLIWSTLVAFGDIILLFFLAWIVSYILDPVSVFLRRRGIPRVVAVSLIYIALLVVISGGIVLTIPTIRDEVTYLAKETTTALSGANLESLRQNALDLLLRAGLRQTEARSMVDQAASQIPNLANRLANEAVAATTSLVTSVLTILINVFFITILSFYIMMDGGRLLESIVQRLPPRWLPDIRLFQRNVDVIFGGFLRAQLIIAAIYGLLTWAVLLALGQANGLLVALLSGLIMLIPMIGPMLAVIPPVLLLLLQASPSELATKMVILLIVLVLAQQVVMQFIAPRVFSSTMGVHPLLFFAAILIGAKVSGVWGAFFAGPIVAVAAATFQVFYDRFARSSPLFDARPDADDGPEPPAEADAPPPQREAMARTTAPPHA